MICLGNCEKNKYIVKSFREDPISKLFSTSLAMLWLNLHHQCGVGRVISATVAIPFECLISGDFPNWFMYITIVTVNKNAYGRR